MKKTQNHFFILLATVFFAASCLIMTQAFAKNVMSFHEMGQGKPLVLIHAYPTDHRLWKPQEELSKYFRVITIDLSGFGSSASTNKQMITMDDYADEVKKLLDQLHIQKAIIGGESMGGYVSLAFLKRYPNNVSGLILSDTQAIADTQEMQAKREATAAEILAHGPDKFIQSFMPIALSPHASKETQDYLLMIVKQQSSSGMAAALRGIAYRHDHSSLLQGTFKPILILTGDQDQLISPQQSEAMHQLARNSRLLIIKDAGHLSSLEQPKQWNNAVIDTFYSGRT